VDLEREQLGTHWLMDESHRAYKPGASSLLSHAHRRDAIVQTAPIAIVLPHQLQVGRVFRDLERVVAIVRIAIKRGAPSRRHAYRGHAVVPIARRGVVALKARPSKVSKIWEIRSQVRRVPEEVGVFVEDDAGGEWRRRHGQLFGAATMGEGSECDYGDQSGRARVRSHGTPSFSRQGPV
jgi:hypothetical protein